MANLDKLKKMTSEPASKEWFKKYGLPKSIKNHPLKHKVASKMASNGELKKAEKGEKQHSGYGEKRDYRKIDVYHNGKYAHSTTWAKNLKEAKINSKLDGGKVKAEYSKLGRQ